MSSDRVAARLAAIAILAGSTARIWAYTHRGSLWLDEAALSLNILNRSWLGLARPLYWGQAAPLGFLWLEHALTSVFGAHPSVLRLWPAVCGIAILPLTWLVGKRIAGSAAAALATTALSGSLLAIRYGAEVKPYESDALVALILIAIAEWVRREPRDLGRWLVLGAAGVLALVLSLPAAFVLGAIGVALLTAPVVRAVGRPALARLVLCACAWLLCFAGVWLGGARASAGSTYLHDYWSPVMLDFTARDFPARLARAAASLAWVPLHWTGSLTGALVATLVWFVGLGVMWKRSRSDFVLLAGPVALAAMASASGLYPLADRLVLFTVPLVLMTQAAAVSSSLAWIGRLWRRQRQHESDSSAERSLLTGHVLLASCVLALWTGTDAWRMLRDPGALEPTEALFHRIAADADEHRIPVYVFARAVPAWLVETTDWSAAERPRVARYESLAGMENAPGFENLSRAGALLPGEGDTLLVRAASGREELIGVASGLRFNAIGPAAAPVPSNGWPTEEARRMANAAHPELWLVASHFGEGTRFDQLRPLVEALRENGLVIAEVERGGRDAIAIKVRRKSEK